MHTLPLASRHIHKHRGLLAQKIVKSHNIHSHCSRLPAPAVARSHPVSFAALSAHTARRGGCRDRSEFKNRTEQHRADPWAQAGGKLLGEARGPQSSTRGVFFLRRCSELSHSRRCSADQNAGCCVLPLGGPAAPAWTAASGPSGASAGSEEYDRSSAARSRRGSSCHPHAGEHSPAEFCTHTQTQRHCNAPCAKRQRVCPSTL